MNRRTVSIVTWIAVLVTVFLWGLVTTGPSPQRPWLNLPVADAGPGTVITFFGQDFEGDTFVWCIDRSGSMGWGGLINTVKAEVIAAIDQLSEDQEMSLVAFSSNYIVWSAGLLPASDDNKASAISWVNGLTATGNTCMLSPLLASVDLAEQTSGSSPHLLLVADGTPFCGGVNDSAEILAEVTAANTQDVPFGTVYLGTDAAGAAFMDTLAALNDGPFIPIGGGFLRGDADGDGNVSALVDGLFILSAQFVAGSPQPECLDAADVDDNGTFTGLVDGVSLLSWGFVPGSPPPPAPGVVTCGSDPTSDALDCMILPGCP